MSFPSSLNAALRASFAFLLLAGCSGNGSQSSVPGPPTQPLAVEQKAPVSAASRTSNVTIASSRITTCPYDRVYVSNYLLGDIEIYPKDWSTSPIPCATLTHDTLGPSALSVGADGSLYVTNYCCNQISVFPRDEQYPSRRIATAGPPNYAYVGADGTVYSSEITNQVEEFAPGATSATRTLSVAGSQGVATDSKNNLYVVSDVFANSKVTGHVLKFAPGATTGTDLGLTIGPAGAIKIAKDDSLVIGTGSQVDIFPPGATVASRSFTTISPFDIALSNQESKLYVASSEYAGGVAEYDFNSGTLLGTIKAGLLEPDGVAYDPPAPY
jgi:hypothetical protein